MSNIFLPHPLTLPPSLSPDALEALTDLTTMLERVRLTLQVATATGITGVVGPASTTPAGAPTPSGAGPLSFSSTSSLSLHDPSAPLRFKDVPAATDGLKHKLQRARTLLRTLPDMARTVAEQEAEVAALEARIASQRAVLEGLKAMAPEKEG